MLVWHQCEIDINCFKKYSFETRLCHKTRLCQLFAADGEFDITEFGLQSACFFYRENDQYKADRLVQALEAGEFIQMTANDTDAVVYCGDFNTESGDLPHRVLTSLYGLCDAQEDIQPKLRTCYAKENSYRTCDGNQNPREITIDYVMFKSFHFMKVTHTI